ncbi:MAG TPA: phosphate-starvation-inducible PsiE family protein [Candidatus Sericytochromatia bacterium]
MTNHLRRNCFIGYPHTIPTVRQAMRFWRRLIYSLQKTFSDESFSKMLRSFEGFISKVLSIAMIFVILLAVYDLLLFLFTDVFTTEPYGRLGTALFTIFGLFLNVLIALEILENITAYLKHHAIQVELVIATSLVAVSRKIIILDLQKIAGLDLIALAVTVLSLAISYWLVRGVHRRSRHQNSDD